MAFDPDLMSSAGSAIGAGLGGIFSDYKDPFKEAMPYFNKIPKTLERYLSPYINRGSAAGDVLQGQYGNLLQDPGGMLNKIGGGYQQSPGFKFALQQALQGAGHAAAAGGMAGSPQHEQQEMELATNLSNQDYNNWIRNALGLYSSGLGGEENLYGIGARAGVGMGEDLASVLANQAKLASESANAQNQREGGLMGMLGSGLGMIGGTLLGGPVGGMIGSSVGKFLGG